MKKSVFYIFFFSFIVFLLSVTGSGCANIIPPSGGPRDSLPPVLVNATPKDSTLNFKGRHISLTFDEYVDLQDVQQNLLFTPLFETVPNVEVRLKTINVRMRDSLAPNTTYTLDFGNAIKDINEGNILRNFKYVFSTGNYLDSLELSGKVILAADGKVDSSITVVLHTDLTDSAVIKHRPRYAARLDSAGNFVFHNLPRDTFAIYAIGDAGTLRRYTSPNQYFAFADSTLIPGQSSPITLYAYKEETQPKAPARTAAPADKRLKLTTSGGNGQDLLSDFTISVERPLRTFDSTQIRLSTDSTFTPVTDYSLSLDTSRTKISLKTAWQEGASYNLIIGKDFAEDTLGRKLLKTDTLNFVARKKSDYGSLRIRMRNVDTALHPVLQFVQGDQVAFSAPVQNGLFSRPLFEPGEYELRVLYDRNGNGKWDAGQFFGVKRQPELVRPLNQKITVKPKYDNQFNVTL